MRDERISEVMFEQLSENDTVVVETQHNVYTFRLRDTEHQMGELAGGTIGVPSQAVLGGTVEEEEFLADRLRIGGRAIFFSSAAPGTMAFTRIVTSPISSLRLDRAA